jgi:ACS family hexuronate transporter-like MFS transporter
MPKSETDSVLRAPAEPVGGEPAPSRLRWIMVGLGFAATLINYLDRQTLSVAAPVLRKQFGIGEESYGLIVSAFMLAYTVSNGLSGALLDRLGTRIGYAMCMVWWSTAGILHALAAGPLSLGIFRFLLGMGEAGNWPAAVKVVTEWFPPRERALASGIFNSGSALGAILAPPLVVWILLQWGWKCAFVMVGLAGYLWLVAWWFIYRTPGNVQRGPSARPALPWELLRTQFGGWFTVSRIFIDPAWYFYIFWFAKYLNTERAFSLAEIGKTAWIPFLAAGLGNLAGGALVALLLRFMPLQDARKAGFTVFAAMMTAAIPAVFASSVAWSIAWVSLASFGYTGSLANSLAFPADVFPKNMVASIYGLASMGSGFGGMIFSWLSGLAISRFGYTPVFVGYGIMPLFSIAIVLFLMGPLSPDPRFQKKPGNISTGAA